ncbi:MAG TPA: glutamine amidotransferase family protein [Firmicutes bacterium]|nr:glutamine amidotransferase family protein [Bacillota bacterium]
MRNLDRITNPFNDDKVIANCGIFGVMNTAGGKMSGRDVIEAMANMHDRGNGLGGGFAAYGIYPEHPEEYALHVMFETQRAREETERALQEWFRIGAQEPIPTRNTRGIANAPILWRYFVEPLQEEAIPPTPDGAIALTPDDYVVDRVMVINTSIDGAFVFSSGKNMGVFKGVGHAEDIGTFFCLDEYQAYLWTGHSRFPTNTQAWWGGAHPFSILDWTVVHNGEISSYGTNRAFLEMYGYYCSMHTDTEVIAYATDLLVRKHGLPISVVAKVFAAPLWQDIDRMPSPDRETYTALRQVYGSLLMNGPFAVIIAHQGEMIGLRDRINLRPLVAGSKGDLLFLASEEAPIRLVCPDVERTWAVQGGEPVIGRLFEGIVEPGVDRSAVYEEPCIERFYGHKGQREVHSLSGMRAAM